MKQKQLKSLQQGRGLAAMAVVAFHLSLLLGNSRYLNDPIFINFTHRGNLGVDFFFVLSGFIIVFAHHNDINRPERVSDYLLKRFTRLFPAYWLYTAIFCGLVALGFGSASIIPETLNNWISTLFLVRLDSFELPITPAWTLIHELALFMFIYFYEGSGTSHNSIQIPYAIRFGLLITGVTACERDGFPAAQFKILSFDRRCLIYNLSDTSGLSRPFC